MLYANFLSWVKVNFLFLSRNAKRFFAMWNLHKCTLGICKILIPLCLNCLPQSNSLILHIFIVPQRMIHASQQSAGFLRINQQRYSYQVSMSKATAVADRSALRILWPEEKTHRNLPCILNAFLDRQNRENLPTRPRVGKVECIVWNVFLQTLGFWKRTVWTIPLSLLY